METLQYYLEVLQCSFLLSLGAMYLTKLKQPCMHINYNNVHQLIADMNIISVSCQPWFWELTVLCCKIHFCLKHSISIQVGYFINNNGGESWSQPRVQWSCQEVKIFTLSISSLDIYMIFSTERRRRTWRRLRSPGVCTRRGWTSSAAPSSSSSARSDISTTSYSSSTGDTVNTVDKTVYVYLWSTRL